MKEDAYTLFQQGKELLETGNPHQAALVLERAKRLQPKKASIREALARAYYNFGEYLKARDEFEKALEIDPTNHYAHFGLGLSFNKMGKTVLALKHLRMACAMKPDSEDYLRALKEINIKEKLKLPAEVKVSSYASFKGEERPVSFSVGDIKYEIEGVIKMWREENLKSKVRKTYFLVKTSYEKYFVLSYNLKTRSWLLEKMMK